MAAGDDDAFCAAAAEALAGLPGVRAVALGGSRAAGMARPDSDWDFAVYYRGGESRMRDPGGGEPCAAPAPVRRRARLPRGSLQPALRCLKTAVAAA
jgi:predicted nucleotidyltransferase